MKLVFTFTDTVDLDTLSKDAIFRTTFTLPDEAQQLVGYEQRILRIAEIVGGLTDAALHVTCKEASINDQFIKPPSKTEKPSTVFGGTKAHAFCFQPPRMMRKARRQLFKVWLPIFPLMSQTIVLRSGIEWFPLDSKWPKIEEEKAYMDSLKALVDQVLVLLNADPKAQKYGGWTCAGYHPWRNDNTLISRHNKRIKRNAAERRKREREEERQKAREAKRKQQGLPPSETPETGAGRRFGAIPGVFKGVQFRSQLEIRLATELESRGVRWVYEPERLGEGNYLVDFYLPDYAVWIEAKGRFEARDHYLLKDVADYLNRERKERLYVFTSNKGYKVNPSGFREMSRKDFWKELLK
jgi:hypothetical protein